MLVFYDFEVFKFDWLVVCIDANNEKQVIVNDNKALKKYYEEHKNDIWVGFNSRRYDQFILKALLCDFNAYEISDYIINKDKSGYTFNREMNNIQLYNYDVYTASAGSLKTLEGFMGNDIKETEVPFNINRKLTTSEINETIKYCTHDVEQLIEVFMLKKDDFESHLNMIKEFKLPLSNIDKTTAQLISVILKANKTERNDEFDVKIPDTLKLSKYKFIADWFLNSYDEVNASLMNQYSEAKQTMMNSFTMNEIKKAKEFIYKYEHKHNDLFKETYYNNTLEVDVAGCKHLFAWGGVHGALNQYSYTCKKDELLLMADVSSLYPSIMLQYDLQSRNIEDKTIYKKIYDTNIEMKKNKDKRRPVYKLICNTTYGCMGDKFNALYDQRNRNLVCVYGQLLLLDLIEKLEPYCKLIQSNTDGILILIKKKDFEKIDDIIYEWETRTRLSMEVDFYKKVVQKDVNNYIVVDFENKYKSKGAYIKKLNKLDYDLPIVNKAMIDYLVNDIPVEQTINNCNNLLMFQKIVKLSSNYDYVMHNNRRYSWKCYRVFASKDEKDTSIYKGKNSKCDKFANTPENCFIDNDNINNKIVPAKLDKDWYIELTKERLKQFGL
ncbi:MAG: hypothetical protein SPJ27_07635 [Candidatus Onthovivens sp.]|nr:hypothetical protein [Candidatus Onthovivens sp.]